jgi:ribonuclease BN (tRNA processing enzyme)
VSELVFVGTSDAFGAGGRRQSAMLLRAGNGTALIDCGATTSGGLCELAIARDEIDAILISHFHGDHFGGIPFLLLGALYEDRRRRPLWIAGPRGIEQRVRALANAMGYSLDDREWSFPIHFEELHAGREREIGPVRVEAFQVFHQPETEPHGLVLRSGGRRLVYSGDTGFFPRFAERVGEADLFVCECTYLDNDFDYHINHQDLVARRHEFHCARIVLTHLGEEMLAYRDKAAFDTADDGLRLRF